MPLLLNRFMQMYFFMSRVLACSSCSWWFWVWLWTTFWTFIRTFWPTHWSTFWTNFL